MATETKKETTEQINTWNKAIKWLKSRENLEKTRVARYNSEEYKLDRTVQLMKAMGNPHKSLKCVHVVGTVGKGSVTTMISSMLQNAGYTVGSYTSPHLEDVRERISINKEYIPKKDFIDLCANIEQVSNDIKIEPTYFEIMTVMGITYFANQAVDIAIIEAGLGGRLDCTNVISPELVVVAEIDFDHTQILGSTLEKIASEKAGVFKKNIPIVSHKQTPEVEEVLISKAKSINAPIKILDRDIEFSRRFGSSEELGPHMRICLISDPDRYMHVPVPLPGDHQAMNCGLSIAALDHLRKSGFECSKEQIISGLTGTSLPGRMETIWESPRILIDGAHNPAAIRSLIRTLGVQAPYDSLICIFGCCQDKDTKSMLEQLALGADKVIFTKASKNPRAADPESLFKEFSNKSGKMAQFEPDINSALETAARAAGRDDLICIFGSFYLAGEAKEHLATIAEKRSAKTK